MGIVLVTGKTDDIDRIVGLEIGADDYVTKPFNPRELLARVTNLLRRIHSQSEEPIQHKSIYAFDGLLLDASRRHLLGRDQQEVKLTRAEFELLFVFMAHPGQVLNRDRLLSQVTHRSWDPNDRTIDVLIMRLRRKLNVTIKTPAVNHCSWRRLFVQWFRRIIALTLDNVCGAPIVKGFLGSFTRSGKSSRIKSILVG